MPTYIEVEKNQFNQLPNASGDGTVIFAVSSSGMIVLKDVNGNNISSEETSSYSISASYSPSQTPDITDNTDLHYVGINNLTPSYSLDVTGTTQTTNLYLSGGDYAGAYIKTANLSNYLTLLSGTPGDSGSGFTAVGDISISATQGAVRLFSNSDEGITVANDSGILVGINNTNPQYTLDVSGRIANSIGDLIIQAGIDNETPWLGVPADLYLNADCGGHEVYIGDAGKIYLGGGGTMVDCSLGNIYNIGAYKLTGGDSNSYVGCNGGNFGIGMTTPNYTLDVTGDINFAGNLYNGGSIYVPTNAVTASYITSSNIVGTVLSSSYSVTSSYLIGYVPPTLVTSSISSSWASSSISSSYSATASNINFIPNLSNTSSYITSSGVVGLVLSSSYSISASYVPNLYPVIGYVTTSSFNSYTSSNDSKVNNLITSTSSYLTTSSIINSSISSSWASSSLSSSYALSSSAATSITFIPNLSNTASYVTGSNSYISNITVNNISSPHITDLNISAATNIIGNNLNLNSGVGVLGNGGNVNINAGSGHVQTGGIQGNVLLSASLVGINQFNPQFTLDVNGDINFAGNLYNGGSIYVPTNAVTASYLIGYVPPTLVTSSISASWASSSLSSNAVSQSNLIGTSSLYSQTYILTGSYKEIITSSYTLTSTENGRLLIVNSGSIVTLTVPSTLPQGFACSMFQSGSGQVTVLGSGVNIRNRTGLSSSYAQYSVISLIQLDQSNFLLGGDVG